MDNVKSALRSDEWELVLKYRQLHNESQKKFLLDAVDAIIFGYGENRGKGLLSLNLDNEKQLVDDEKQFVKAERRGNVAIVCCDAWGGVGQGR